MAKPRGTGMRSGLLLHPDERTVKMASADLTAARLRELLHYEPDTGVFTWRVNRRGFARIGDKAGTPKKEDGRNRIVIDGKRYAAARLAWLYMTGAWPVHEVDHEDTDPTNDRWRNLRDIPHRHNMQNMRRAPSHKASSPLLGAQWIESEQKWHSRIRTANGSVYLGRFDTAEEAHAAYVDAKRQMHEGCTL